MILLVLGMAGCQRTVVTQQPGITQQPVFTQTENPQMGTSQAKVPPATPETQAAQTSSQEKIVQTAKFPAANLNVNPKIYGIWEGISTSSSVCKFAVDLDVQTETVTGEGVGTGPAITCEIKLNGTVDDEGNMSGQAKAVYTLSGKIKVEWYLAGPFVREADSDNGNMIIKLYGTGNNCALVMPKATPCTNNSDTIILELEKV